MPPNSVSLQARQVASQDALLGSEFEEAQRSTDIEITAIRLPSLSEVFPSPNLSQKAEVEMPPAEYTKVEVIALVESLLPEKQSSLDYKLNLDRVFTELPSEMSLRESEILSHLDAYRIEEAARTIDTSGITFYSTPDALSDAQIELVDEALSETVHRPDYSTVKALVIEPDVVSTLEGDLDQTHNRKTTEVLKRAAGIGSKEVITLGLRNFSTYNSLSHQGIAAIVEEIIDQSGNIPHISMSYSVDDSLEPLSTPLKEYVDSSTGQKLRVDTEEAALAARAIVKKESKELRKREGHGTTEGGILSMVEEIASVITTKGKTARNYDPEGKYISISLPNNNTFSDFHIAFGNIEVVERVGALDGDGQVHERLAQHLAAITDTREKAGLLQVSSSVIGDIDTRRSPKAIYTDTAPENELLNTPIRDLVITDLEFATLTEQLEHDLVEVKELRDTIYLQRQFARLDSGASAFDPLPSDFHSNEDYLNLARELGFLDDSNSSAAIAILDDPVKVSRLNNELQKRVTGHLNRLGIPRGAFSGVDTKQITRFLNRSFRGRLLTAEQFQELSGFLPVSFIGDSEGNDKVYFEVRNIENIRDVGEFERKPSNNTSDIADDTYSPYISVVRKSDGVAFPSLPSQGTSYAAPYVAGKHIVARENLINRTDRIKLIPIRDSLFGPFESVVSETVPEYLPENIAKGIARRIGDLPEPLQAMADSLL